MQGWILANGLTVLGLGGYAVFGVMTFTGFFKKDDSRRKESDTIADTLISRLQAQVTQMQKDMDEHAVMRDTEIKTLRSQVDHLSGRNSVLEDLFKGRDPAMQVFFKDAPKLFDIAHENNGLAKENAQAIQNLTGTMAKFVDTLQPLLIHLELSPRTAGAVQ